MAGCPGHTDAEARHGSLCHLQSRLRSHCTRHAGEELALTRTEQDALLARLADGTLSGAEKTKALDVQQIRNIAEIIQRTRPDVLLLSEFDNDGKGSDTTDLKAFNANYLAHAQHDEVKAIGYPVLQNFATNTGLMSGHDLNLDGKRNNGPDDAWGFGNYHGQYAFAVMSRYPIDTRQIRTFQKFKWKEMPGEANPVIDDCHNPRAPIPSGRQWRCLVRQMQPGRQYPLVQEPRRRAGAHQARQTGRR